MARPGCHAKTVDFPMIFCYLCSSEMAFQGTHNVFNSRLSITYAICSSFSVKITKVKIDILYEMCFLGKPNLECL